MTIASETTQSGPFVFNDVTTTFAYGFRILSSAEIEFVSIDDTTKIISTIDPSNYSVTGVGDAGGGNVVFTTAPAAGATGYVRRKSTMTQPVVLTDVGPFYPSVVMQMVDRTTMYALELREVQNRSLRGRPGETYDYLPAKSELANGFLAFDTDGDPIAAAGVASMPVSAAMAPVVAAATIQAATDLIVFAAPGNAATRALPEWLAGYGRGSDELAHVGFWPDVTPAMRKHIFRDRVFIAAGANANGNFNTSQGANAWAPTATEGANWALRDTDLVVVSSIGRQAIGGFTRTSDQIQSPALGYGAAIGVQGLLINNGNAGGTGTFGWAFYGDVQHEGGALAWSAGMERAVKNKSATNYTTSPYNWQSAGVFVDWHLIGGDDSYGGANVNPITAIFASRHGNGANPAANAGWVLKDGTLVKTGGIATVLHMPEGYALRWDRSNDTTAARIYSQVTNTSQPVQALAFSDNGIWFTVGGLIALSIDSVASIANRVHVAAAATGASPIIYSTGSDANVALTLRSKAAADVIAQRIDANTNAVVDVLTVQEQTTGAPANGIGAAICFEVETAAGNLEKGARVAAVATDVTAASEDFDLAFSVMKAGAAPAEVFRLKSLGQARLVPLTADPATLENGDIWYLSATHKFRGRAGGVSVDLH